MFGDDPLQGERVKIRALENCSLLGGLGYIPIYVKYQNVWYQV